MLATINVLVLLVWLLAELIPGAADHLAALDADGRHGKDGDA